MNNAIDPARISSRTVITPHQDMIGQIVLSILLALAIAGSYAALWGGGLWWQEIKASAVWVVPTFLAGFVVHEWLHAVGFRVFGGVPREAVSFTVNWRQFDLRTVCHAPVTAAAYRKAALLPALVLAMLPALASLVFGIGWLAFLSILNFSSVTSDLMLVWVIRSFAGDDLVAMVGDSPDASTGNAPGDSRAPESNRATDGRPSP